MDGPRTGRAETESILHIGRKKLHRNENAERKAERGDPRGREEGGKIRGKFSVVSGLSDGRKTKRENPRKG